MTNKQSRLAAAGVLLLFAAALACQWGGHRSIPTSDGISYIASGVGLIRTGRYLNSFGELDLWFPPLYPVLIGALSLGGSLDPLLVARVISAAFATLGLVFVFRAGRAATPGVSHAGAFAAGILAANSLYQEAGSAALSLATATVLLVAAFALWVGLPDKGGTARLITIGCLIGASYLTRPEAILLLPAWAMIDIWARPTREQLRRYAAAAIACAIFVAPYAAWLSARTGRLTITNKGEVNLAAGRAAYYGAPREYIDPETLEMSFYEHRVTAGGETRRYLSNLGGIGRAYAKLYGGPIGAGLLVMAGIGAVSLARRRQIRMLLGLLAQFAYLLVMAWYAADDPYLHATLPALSLLAAFGIGASRQAWCSPARLPRKWAAAALLAWVCLGLVEMGSRLPRWSLTTADDPLTLLRDAGLSLKAKGVPGGVVYERGATIGYFAGQRRGRLTQNDLGTISRYIHKVEDERTPVWLAVSRAHSELYHPSVRSLLDSDEETGFLRRVIELSDGRGKVVIYEVD